MKNTKMQTPPVWVVNEIYVYGENSKIKNKEIKNETIKFRFKNKKTCWQ